MDVEFEEADVPVEPVKQVSQQPVAVPGAQRRGPNEGIASLLLGKIADYVRVVDSDEPCGGYPLWAAGHRDAFRYHARRFAESLRKHTRVISTCPACVYLVREVYRQRPDLTIYNHYGPTEATTVVTMARIPRDLAGEPPLGTPVRAAEVVLVAER